MPPEQVEEIRAWLIKAARDLEAARRLIDAHAALEFVTERVPEDARP